jgi:transcription initiation factor IIE alpha subunit
MTREEFENLAQATETLINNTQCPDCGEEMEYMEITDLYGDIHWIGFCNCQHEIEEDDEMTF